MSELSTLQEPEVSTYRSFEGYLESADSAGNLRRHLIRALARITALFMMDTAVIFGARRLLSVVREGGLGADLARMAGEVLPAGSVTLLHLVGAVSLGMLAVGAYRAGDRWTDPVRILSAAGVAVVLLYYRDLWGEQLGLTLARGVILWIALGLGLVVVRWGLGRLASMLAPPRLKHRVLEIRGGEESKEPSVLGPRFEVIGVLRASELPPDVEEMEHWLVGGVDTLVVSGELSPEDFGRLTDFALAHGCRLLCPPRSFELSGLSLHRVWLTGKPFTDLTMPSLRASQMVVKRALDIAGALVLLIVSAPLLILISCALWIEREGPVFFHQRRAGYRGCFFRLVKFRSMRADAEEILRHDREMYRRYVDNNFKLPENEDPRITPLGYVLRKTSLDELPQLLNVLKGDMSLVGPRPVVEAELEMYRGRIPTLLSVKPGLTGPWQISGRSRIGFPERAQMDLDYVRNWSLLRDVWILVMTVPAVLMQRGAH